MAKHKIVITGGGGSGKSSLIEYFIAQGFCAIREAAREQIRISLEQHSNALPWDDILAFSQKVQAQMLLDYQKYPDSEFCFFDRCLLDVLSYLKLDNYPPYPELLADIQNYKYFKTVFILPPWQEIFTKDEERTEDFEETVRAFDRIKNTYQEYGYEPVEIPPGTIEQRALFILDYLKKNGLDVTA
jgi:predicted ATPase